MFNIDYHTGSSKFSPGIAAMVIFVMGIVTSLVGVGVLMAIVFYCTRARFEDRNRTVCHKSSQPEVIPVKSCVKKCCLCCSHEE